MTTQERVRELLDYDENTGEFRWKQRRGGRALAGSVAGVLRPDGYVKIVVDHHPYLAHRLAWLHFHGEWPSEQLDHINGVRDDNRIDNLREATNGENQQNIAGAKKGNRIGLLGVSYHPQSGKYRARIKHQGRVIDCGLHDTPEAAHQSYLRAKVDHHTHHAVEEDA